MNATLKEQFRGGCRKFFFFNEVSNRCLNRQQDHVESRVVGCYHVLFTYEILSLKRMGNKKRNSVRRQLRFKQIQNSQNLLKKEVSTCYFLFFESSFHGSVVQCWCRTWYCTYFTTDVLSVWFTIILCIFSWRSSEV